MAQMNNAPICTWTFDEQGNLAIQVLAEMVTEFGKWLNDEYGDVGDSEMYRLMDECKEERNGRQ